MALAFETLCTTQPLMYPLGHNGATHQNAITAMTPESCPDSPLPTFSFLISHPSHQPLYLWLGQFQLAAVLTRSSLKPSAFAPCRKPTNERESEPKVKSLSSHTGNFHKHPLSLSLARTNFMVLGWQRNRKNTCELHPFKQLG